MGSDVSARASRLGELPENWTIKSLGDVCDVKGRIGWRGYTIEDIKDSGPLVIGATQITHDNRLDLSKPTYLSRAKFDESPEIKIDRWDILVVKVGNTIGKVALVRTDLGEACINPNAVLLKRATIDPRFLFYYLTGAYAQHFLRANSSASAQPAINQTVLKTLAVPVPPREEQIAIAHILGTLDDKIELNRRMNETLEAMARAIFKSWFVDFDPVRAKAEGRDPGLPKDIADLFLDRFEDSDLGEIPAGWAVDSLGNLIELAYGKALKQEGRKAGPVAVFGSNGQVGWHDEKLIAGPGIVVGRKGNPGVVKWVPTDFFPIDTTFYVVPKGECRSLHFLFYALKIQDLASLGADSAVPGLNRNLAYMSKQIVPSRTLLDTFDSSVQPLFQRIYEADNESGALAGLRDALLPKLISGELRVKDAERLLEVQP